MPMLADLDDPPRPRTKGLLFGLAVGLIVTVVFMGWLIPTFVGAILGGAQSLDKRLRDDDDYMKRVCSAMELPRDEALCQCVAAVEFPSLDCREAFHKWSIARQHERCRDPATREAALSFCSCIDAVQDAIETADERDGQASAGAYERCEQLPDALALPEPPRVSDEF